MTNTTDALPQVFATLRFSGDNLDPQEIRAILPIGPRRAHRKGELYYSGRRAGYLQGRTGIWYLTTDLFTDSRNLSDHLAVLQRFLRPTPDDNQRLIQLRDIIGRGEAKAGFSIYWHGRAGDKPPDIPGEFASLASELWAEIETDYHTEKDAALIDEAASPA
jgi:hypothetical protein